MSAFADLTLASESIRSQAENELYMHPSCLPEFVKLYIGRDDRTRSARFAGLWRLHRDPAAAYPGRRV